MDKNFGGREERAPGPEKNEEPGFGREPAWYEKDEGETPWFEKPVEWLSESSDSASGQILKPQEENFSPDSSFLSRTPLNSPSDLRSRESERKSFAADCVPQESGREREKKDEKSDGPTPAAFRETGAKAGTSGKLDLNEFFTPAKTKKDRKSDARRDSEKIYLPSPPPAFVSDTISHAVLYIEKNFETNPAVADSGEKRKSGKLIPLGGMLVSLLCAALGVLLLLRSEEYLEGAFFTAVGVVMAGVFFVALLRGCKKKIKAGDFRLVKPYAVKKEFSPLHGLSGAEVSFAGEERQIFLFDGGLRLYYEEKGKRREAVTDKIYSEEELGKLVSAFLGGRLVVACKRTSGDALAVVCSPDVKGRREET